MVKTELIELEELQGRLVEEILTGTGIERRIYEEYREGKKEITETDAKKLSDFFKVPKSFFLKLPALVHHGSENSYGPIYYNSNFYFAKPETEEDIKRLLNK
ncbi:hypothetical protein [Sphingobacterium multivorum]|uniref:hypothetical protein n=1 Tax=Sphingobacterium multivorum TaxID=28454 RepID=UPI003DA2F412